MAVKKSNRKLASARDIAKNANISYAAVNNYTDMGLLDVVARQNRTRMYDSEKAKERLSLISKLINEGYTLRVIGKLLREE
ncbi:MAG: MerR family transcriptional regulator [Candidatus Omnitrophica bacterium]|nr:MerR family transcriptional regulator [Candidatus Omnitrophota bacterium]